MDDPRPARRADLIFALLTIGGGAVFFHEARKLPAARFDPLGPASFPLAISGLLVAMGLVALGMALFGRRLGDAETSLVAGVNRTGPAARRRPLLAVFCFAAVATYVLALQAFPGRYMWATATLIAALGIAMSARDARAVAVAIAIGVGASLFLDHLFGTLLRLPMP